MKLLLFIILTVLIGITAIAELPAQKNADPLKPQELPPQREWGVFVGFGPNTQLGTMFVECPDCYFDGGRGTGFIVGGLYEHEIFPRVRFGGSVSYEYLGFRSLFREYEPVDFLIKSTGETETLPVSFRHEADVTLNYLSLTPYIKWYPTYFMFLKLGFSASYVLTNNITHNQQIIDRWVILRNGDSAYVEYVNDNGEPIASDTKVNQDSEITGINQLQFSVNPAIGFHFSLGSKMELGPVFQYSIPLTKITENGEGFSVSSWRFLLEFRMSIDYDQSYYWK